MGCGVAEGKQRTEFLQTLLGLLAFNGLRFVNNQNRIGLGNNIDRTAGTEFVQFHVNSSGILALGVECLGVNNHNIDGVIRSEAVNLRKLCGVVDEEANLLPVFLCKMLLGHLEGLVDTFTDSHAQYNHDELTPTVVLVQFIHGFDIGVGLPTPVSISIVRLNLPSNLGREQSDCSLIFEYVPG